MNKTSRNRIFLFLTVTLLALLTGCQVWQRFTADLNAAGNQPTLPPEASPEIPFATTAPQVEQASSERSVTLWLPPQFNPEDGSTAGNLLKARLADFTTDHPDIKLYVRIKVVEGKGGLLDTLSSASTAAPSALPGLVFLLRSDLESAARNGLITPLENVSLVIKNDQWFESASQLASVNGTLFGIPYAGDSLALAYRPLQVSYPPRTWREVVQQKSIVSFPGLDPKAALATAIYLQSGEKIIEEEQKVILQPESLLASLQVIAEGAAAEVFPYWLIEQNSYTQSWQAFLEGRSTYAISWTSQILDEKESNISISPLPSSGEKSSTLLDGWVLAFPLSSYDRYPDAALLVEYLLEPDFYTQWTESAGFLPNSRDVLSGWREKDTAEILSGIAETAHVIPSNMALEAMSPLLNEATEDLLRQQVSYIQAANTVMAGLEK